MTQMLCENKCFVKAPLWKQMLLHTCDQTCYYVSDTRALWKQMLCESRCVVKTNASPYMWSNVLLCTWHKCFVKPNALWKQMRCENRCITNRHTYTSQRANASLGHYQNLEIELNKCHAYMDRSTALAPIGCTPTYHIKYHDIPAMLLGGTDSHIV